MTTFFVSRHPGAVLWLRRRGLDVDRRIVHLDPADCRPGDTVVGALPVHLAAEVLSRSGRYLHLSHDLPPAARGRELSADDPERYGARLEEYTVSATHAEHEPRPEHP